jgi:hypothetical protein
MCSFVGTNGIRYVMSCRPSQSEPVSSGASLASGAERAERDRSRHCAHDCAGHRVRAHQTRRRPRGEAVQPSRRRRGGHPWQPFAEAARTGIVGPCRRTVAALVATDVAARGPTSTTWESSCTSTHQPATRTMCTGRAVPAAPAPTAWSSRWYRRTGWTTYMACSVHSLSAAPRRR